MNRAMKVMLLVLAVLYWISPVDACPGPIDDILLMVLAILAQSRSTVTKTDL